MPRYIDAKKIRYCWMYDDDGIEHDGVTLHSIVDKTPTEDVVPRLSFVREIFWELNKIIDEYLQGEISTSEFDDMIAACEKKYTEEQT